MREQSRGRWVSTWHPSHFHPSESRNQSDGIWRSTGTMWVCPPPTVVRATRPPPLVTHALPGPAQQPPWWPSGLHTRTLAFQAISSVCMALGLLILLFLAEMSPPPGGVPWFLQLASIPHYVPIKHLTTLSIMSNNVPMWWAVKCHLSH